MSVVPLGPYGMSVWKSIRKGWVSFYANVRFVVGNGLEVGFWHDRWCGDSSFKSQFPLLFQLARNKAAMVSEYLEARDGQVSWSPVFAHAVQDWELGELVEFFKLLYSMKVRGIEEDRMRWDLTSKGFFRCEDFL